MEITELLPTQALRDQVITLVPTGSAHTRVPPVGDTDIDFLLLVRSRKDFTAATAGTIYEGGSIQRKDLAYPDEFDTYRSSDERPNSLNLIVTDDKAAFERFELATYLARNLNIQNKRDRVALFRAVVDGKRDVWGQPDRWEGAP